MKKFIIWFIAFVVAIVAVDFGFGAACRYLIAHAKAGFTQSHEYVANHCEDDVLIFGSSRALHHYVPEVITDSLGMSCYNCGMDGNGILYLYSRFLMLTSRYNPKIIIYDVEPVFDLSIDDYTKYLGWQKRYCEIPGVMNVITDINPIEKWKLLCSFYKYNGSFVQMLADNLHPLHTLDKTGYEPLFNVMDYEPEVKQQTRVNWDAKKRSYFEKLVEDCNQKNIFLIFAYSPMYGMQNTAVFDEFTEFCKEHNVALINYYACEDYVFKKELFSDSYHLNDIGAREYTKKIVKDMKVIIKSKNEVSHQ